MSKRGLSLAQEPWEELWGQRIEQPVGMTDWRESQTSLWGISSLVPSPLLPLNFPWLKKVNSSSRLVQIPWAPWSAFNLLECWQTQTGTPQRNAFGCVQWQALASCFRLTGSLVMTRAGQAWFWTSPWAGERAAPEGPLRRTVMEPELNTPPTCLHLGKGSWEAPSPPVQGMTLVRGAYRVGGG